MSMFAAKSPSFFLPARFWPMAASLALLAGLPAAHAQLAPKTLVWQGATRTWFEHVPPSYDGSRPVPLVIALHGNYGKGDEFAPVSEWMPKADSAGFIAVFPNGGVTAGENSWGWNAFVFDGSAPDDAGFLLALIQRLETDYRIDPARIYMVGFSNGGGMTSTFAGLHASTLAAIAPVSGGWLTSFGIPDSAMHPDAPLPAWVWRGANENFQNGSLTLAEQDRQQTQYWVRINQDNPAPQTAPQQSSYTTQIYTGGAAEVRYTSIAGADHAYQPGTSTRLWDEFFSRFVRGAMTTAAPEPTPTPTPPSAATPPPAATTPVVAVPPVFPPPSDAPVLTITAETPQAFERHQVPGGFLVTRTGGSELIELTVPYLAAGKAVAGSDYKPLRGVVTLRAGADSARIKVRPLKNPDQTANANVRVTLLPGDGYTLGNPSMAKVQIVDRTAE